MLCTVCRESLIDLNKRVYVCHECSPDIKNGDAAYWCKNCKDSSEHEHKREKFK
jgi:predicted amidophosphoribosyltransferase